MKKLISSKNALGKLGIALTFVLPTIGFAEAYSTAITPTASAYSSQPNQSLESRLNDLRSSQELMEGVQNWSQTHAKAQALEKGAAAAKKRMADETAAEDKRLDKVQRSMKGINLAGLDGMVQAMQSMFNGIKRKECKQPLDFSNMFRKAQGMKDFVSQAVANFGKQSKIQQEDLQERAAKLAAELNARQERLAQENPAEAQLAKETAELNQAAKNKDTLLAYMKKQVASANLNAADAVKKNTRLLNNLLNSPTGLVNLLAAIQADQAQFTETATTIMNATVAALGGVATEGENQVANLASACDENLNGVKQAKAQLDPVIDKFNNQDLKRKNKALLARAVKADCSTRADFTVVKATAASVQQQMQTAIANNDPAAFAQVFATAPQAMQDSLNQVKTPAQQLGQACDRSGNWLDFFKQDQGAQDLKKAAETGDQNAAIQQQDPSQAMPQAAPRPVGNFASPALGAVR